MDARGPSANFKYPNISSILRTSWMEVAVRVFSTSWGQGSCSQGSADLQVVVWRDSAAPAALTALAVASHMLGHCAFFIIRFPSEAELGAILLT